MLPRVVLILSEEDPVAVRLRERWPTGESTGDFVDGAPLRSLAPGVQTLARAGRHIFDDHLDRKLPQSYRDAAVPLLFPSVHRSGAGMECLTVHPIGNPGPEASFGGEPFRLAPAAPRLMSLLLRALHDATPTTGVPASFEATHHGPALDLPAVFVEISTAEGAAPAPALVDLFARLLPDLPEEEADRVALAVGGGHYAPHFTELVIERSWAVGHILSRHVLPSVTPAVARAAFHATPGAEGILFARAKDTELPALEGLGGRLRDNDAPLRRTPTRGAGGGPASGT